MYCIRRIGGQGHQQAQHTGRCADQARKSKGEENGEEDVWLISSQNIAQIWVQTCICHIVFLRVVFLT
jgi:hypothetical protein